MIGQPEGWSQTTVTDYALPRELFDASNETIECADPTMSRGIVYQSTADERGAAMSPVTVGTGVTVTLTPSSRTNGQPFTVMLGAADDLALSRLSISGLPSAGVRRPAERGERSELAASSRTRPTTV